VDGFKKCNAGYYIKYKDVILLEVTFAEVKKNFEEYLKIASEIEEVEITLDDKHIGKIVTCMDGYFLNEEALDYFTGERPLMTYEEFCFLTENSELRYEFIDGEVYLLASPNFKHQFAINELHGTFYNWFKGKKCQAFTSPFDVTLYKSEENINVVQPDIIVMCDTDKVDSKGKYKGVPTLVVEVLSPSTRTKDMNKKFELFRMTGVLEYWMVDVNAKTVCIYTFDGNSVADYQVFINIETAESSVFEGLKVSLLDVFID